MKKILSLLCLMMLAIMSAWADDVKVTWAMGESTEAVATPDGYATGAIVLGDGLTNEGSYTWSEIAFTKFQPTAADKGTNGHASAESMKKYVDFKVTPVGGKFTPTKVSFDIIKIGTGDPTMFVDFIDGEGNTITVADNVAIRRNQDATDAISHSFTISSAAASENAATLRILVGKLANNKQVGIANVVVEGIWASSAKTVTFTNDANWEKVFVWAWNSEENFTGGTWPGQELTADVEGKYIWSTMGNPTQIIFNDGGDNKTGDLQFKDGGQYNSTGRIITLNDYTATFTTDGWDNVWAYVWNSDEKALGDWPGTQLEGANGIFNVVIKGEEAPTFIIFHNNAGQQTPDLPFENGKAYEYMMNTYTASFKTDTWKDVYAYAWNGDGDETVKLVGDYPGLQLSAVDGIYTFTYKSFSAPEKILFNNGGTGDGNQTGNYKFVDGKKYQYMTGTPLYTLTDGTVFTAGQTVEVKDGENVVATITYSEAGGNDFNAVTTEYGTVEGWAAFAAMTTGNETNGNAEGGTFYTIKPVFDGIISVAVRLNGGKKFHIAEDGTDLPAYNGWTIPEAMNTTYDFAVKAGSTYKIWCDGSKLGFFGFDYTGYKEEPVAVTATFNFADPNFRANIGETMTDVAGYIYNETFTAEGVSLQITGGSAPSRIYVDNNRGQNLVTYKEYTTLTFRAPEGKAITKIEFTAAGNSNINNFTASSGAIEGMTWTGNAAGVRFLQGGTSYLANAIVTLEATTAETAVLPAIEYVECENIAAFKALEAGTYAKITLTNAEVIGKSADGYSTVWVQDATGGAWIQYTSLNDRLQEGTKVNGTVFTIKRFTAGNPQLKEAEATINSEIASEAISSYTIIEGTIAEVNVADNLNKVVKISGATLTMTNATAGKLTIGEETIDVNNGNETANQALHKIAGWEKDKVLENITITAILVAKSATANQLLPISIEQSDYTSYIVNADLTGEGGFDATGTKGIDGSGIVKCANNAQFDFKQVINNLPAGQYKLTAQAAYRYSGSEADEYAAIAAGTDTKLATLYATVGTKTESAKVMNRWDGASETDYANGDGSTTVNEKYVPNSSNAVKAWFNAGQYVNEVVFNLVEDGNVTIGIVKTAQPEAGDYTVIGPWTLTRLGDAEQPAEQEFSATFKNDVNWEAVYAYTWTGENEAKVEQLGAWPGTELAANAETGLYEVSGKNATLPANIIFHNNAGTQTGDLVFEEGKQYSFNGDHDFAYGKYVLVNFASTKFWGTGNNWDTQATLVDHPVYQMLVPVPDGKYKLETQVSNGGTSYWFGGEYMDSGEGAAVTLTITRSAEPLGYRDEAETLPVYTYTIANGDNYYGNSTNGTLLGQNVAADSEDALWIIIPLDEAKAAVAEGTVDDPMDATVFIEDYNFNRNNRFVDSWQGWGDQVKVGNANGNMNAESYERTFDVYQELSGLPNGVYELNAQAAVTFHDSRTKKPYDGVDMPVVYMNEETSDFIEMIAADQLTSQAQLGQKFNNGDYKVEPLFVQVTDGTLKIGAKSVRADIWAVWDNFVLTYYGNEATIDQVKNAAILAEMNALRDQLETIKDEVEVDAVKSNIAQVLQQTESVTGEEAINAAIISLKEALELAQASVMAKDVLPKMKQLTESTNVYTEEAYEEYYGQWYRKYEAGSLTKAEAATLEDPFVVTGWRASVTVDNFLLSAWDAEADKFEGYYINTWSTEGLNDGSNFLVPFFEYWTGDGDSLGEKTLTATMNGLEKGVYNVSAWVRVRIKNGAEAPATGITLQANDGEAVDVCTGEQYGQMYLKEYTATGNVAEDGVLYIKFNVAAYNNISWLSYQNVKFVPSSATGINSIAADNAAVEGVYNLAGQKVMKAQKGLYIINGKKVVK